MPYWRNDCTSEEGLGNGRHRTTISIRPRAFDEPQPGGGTKRVAIPAALGNSGDAALPIGRVGLLNTRFADRLAGQSPQVHIGRGQQHIRMSALGTNNVAGAPVLDGVGNVIGRRYNGAWQNADLEWLDIGHRVKKHIYLHQGHPQQFEIRVDSFAGKLVASNRGWDLQDDSGRPVLWAGAGYLYKPDDPSALTVSVTTTVRTQGGKQIYTYTLPDGNWAGWKLDPTWASQPGAAEGKDVYLDANSATANYGVNTRIIVGDYVPSASRIRSLLQFDLSAIPSTSLTLVTLNLWRDLDRSNNARTFSVYALLRSWVEGTQNGAGIADGATWNTYDGMNNWGTAGCAGAADAEASAIGTIDEPAGTNAGVVTPVLREISLDAGLVARWLTGALANNGIKLQMATENDDAWGYPSSDHATAANRPKLEVVHSEGDSNRLRWWLLHRP